jgi:hypothetical protein
VRKRGCCADSVPVGCARAGETDKYTPAPVWRSGESGSSLIDGDDRMAAAQPGEILQAGLAPNWRAPTAPSYLAAEGRRGPSGRWDNLVAWPFLFAARWRDRPETGKGKGGNTFVSQATLAPLGRFGRPAINQTNGMFPRQGKQHLQMVDNCKRNQETLWVIYHRLIWVILIVPH